MDNIHVRRQAMTRKSQEACCEKLQRLTEVTHACCCVVPSGSKQGWKHQQVYIIECAECVVCMSYGTFKILKVEYEQLRVPTHYIYNHLKSNKK